MIFKAPHGAFSFVLAVAIFELLWYCNPSWWYGNGKDNISPTYASKKPNQLNNFGPCWVVIYWLVDHPEVAEQFGIKVGFV